MEFRTLIDLIEINSLPKYDTKARQTALKLGQIAEPTDHERNAVDWYRGHGYAQINGKLRGTEPEWAMPSADEMWEEYGFAMTIEDAIFHLDNLAAKAPRRKKAITVYRGETDPKRMALLTNIQIGESFVDPGFLSTSLGPSYAFYGFAKNAISMIIVPPDVQAAYISNIHTSDDHTEIEFLINRNTRYTKLEQRMIPNKNRGHPVKELLLLVWHAHTAGLA